jgi:hypothetical protein
MNKQTSTSKSTQAAVRRQMVNPFESVSQSAPTRSRIPARPRQGPTPPVLEKK